METRSSSSKDVVEVRRAAFCQSSSMTSVWGLGGVNELRFPMIQILGFQVLDTFRSWHLGSKALILGCSNPYKMVVKAEVGFEWVVQGTRGFVQNTVLCEVGTMEVYTLYNPCITLLVVSIFFSIIPI